MYDPLQVEPQPADDADVGLQFRTGQLGPGGVGDQRRQTDDATHLDVAVVVVEAREVEAVSARSELQARLVASQRFRLERRRLRAPREVAVQSRARAEGGGPAWSANGLSACTESTTSAPCRSRAGLLISVSADIMGVERPIA
jgi:hypothetical protein